MQTMYQPDMSCLSGLISHLDNDELKEMLNDDDKFEEVLKDLKQSKDFETEKEMMLASNSSLAVFNMTREPQLVEGRQKIQELSAAGEELSRQVDEKTRELREKAGDLAPDTALALLQTAAAEMEEESDRAAERFLGGDTDADEFLAQFTDSRRLMHLRKVKADKMAELLSGRRAAGAAPNYMNAPPVALNPSYFPAGPVPYPVGPVNMPQPHYFANNY